MPVVTRSIVKPAASPAARNAALAKATVTPPLVLPTDYEEPSPQFTDYSLLIHGEKKVGKTTLANAAGRTLFLQCDPNQPYKKLEVLIDKWSKFLLAMNALEAAVKSNTLGYDLVVIDRVDILYQMCSKHVCDVLNIQHPGDLGYGKGWSAVKTAFAAGIDRFLRLPCGRWFLCHSEWKEVETRSGDKVQKLVPILSGQAEEVVNGKVDGWFAYTYAGKDRIIIVRGDERTGAGNRMDQEEFPRFRTTSGAAVVEIPAGESPREAYTNLIAAFNNQQTTTHVETGEKSSESNETSTTTVSLPGGKGKGKGVVAKPAVVAARPAARR